MKFIRLAMFTFLEQFDKTISKSYERFFRLVI